MRYNPLLFLVLLLPALYLCASAGCSSSTAEPPLTTTCSPDLASIQQIFARSCGQQACHGAIEPAVGLDLTTGDVGGRLIAVPSATCDGRVRVVPGDPDRSALYEKMVEAVPTCGGHMPPGGYLSAEEKACVRQWIAGLPAADAGTDGPAPCEMCGGSACVDLMTDPSSCGACGAACPPGAGCAGGACACSAGLALCGGACVDTAVDHANCGGCGEACPSGALCDAGQCACPGGLEACGGACVEIASDPNNCGACGAACAADEVCNAGKCAVSCGALTKCGASCVDTATSPLHCGACDSACPAGASCEAGACMCPAGTADCGGACLTTTTDPANCGGCGQVCAQGTTCEASACVCPGGGAVCGAGCVDTESDPANCGGCGNVCAAGQACAGGACTCGSASVSFSADVQPIFTASCSQNGCHKGANAQQDLDLTAGNAYQGLVGVAAQQCNDGRKRVLPGQPSQSYLMDKIMDVDLCGGTQMPKLMMLPATQLEAIANWICQGAPNN